MESSFMFWTKNRTHFPCIIAFSSAFGVKTSIRPLEDLDRGVMYSMMERRLTKDYDLCVGQNGNIGIKKLSPDRWKNGYRWWRQMNKGICQYVLLHAGKLCMVLTNVPLISTWKMVFDWLKISILCHSLLKLIGRPHDKWEYSPLDCNGFYVLVFYKILYIEEISALVQIFRVLLAHKAWFVLAQIVRNVTSHELR